MNVVFTPTAYDDLEAIRDYLEPRSLQGAIRVLSAIDTTIALLGDFPLIGRAGRVAETREMPVPATPYVVVYEIFEPAEVYVLRVLHGSEKFPPG